MIAAWVCLELKIKKEKLKVAKRYLKGDFKATLCCYCNCKMLHRYVKKLDIDNLSQCSKNRFKSKTNFNICYKIASMLPNFTFDFTSLYGLRL